MPLVIDSSFALAWALPDESSTRADRFLGRLGEDDLLWVPVSLALSHRLSAYDAAYLELAIRKNLALATMDRALLQAARAAGVETTA
ncbi:MAG: type II toxin-antitoxin system VapC family toxin [Nitrospira sp.]